MVVMCHVTWIIVLVVRGPPKRVEGSIPGDSSLTTSSPPTPWTAAPRMARDPAMISGTFTPARSLDPSDRQEWSSSVPYSSVWMEGSRHLRRCQLQARDTESHVRHHPHATQELDRRGAAGACRRRPGRCPD